MAINANSKETKEKAMISVTIAAAKKVETNEQKNWNKQMNYHYGKSQRFERILKFN